MLVPSGLEEPLDTEGDTELQGEQELQVLQTDPDLEFISLKDKTIAVF